MGTITSANSSLILSVGAVFPVDVPIQGYAADDAFSHASFAVTERKMGVDGILSAGFVPSPKGLEISLQADSPSIDVFDAWLQAHFSLREALRGDVIIAMPSIGKVFTFSSGWFADGQGMPSGKKVLEPQKYMLEFQDLFIAPLF